MATRLIFQKKAGVTIDDKAGIYFLRTSLNGKEEQTLWMIYNAIREIESTFRVLKTDLDLRPIFHKTDDASMAHLHLGLLAYWLVSTIRYQLKQQGIHHDWSEIVRIMNTQKSVTTTIENHKNETIQIRQCSQRANRAGKTDIRQAQIYSCPFSSKKIRVAPCRVFKKIKSGLSARYVLSLIHI